MLESCSTLPVMLSPGSSAPAEGLSQTSFKKFIGREESRRVEWLPLRGWIKAAASWTGIGLLRGWNLTGWRFPEWELVRFQSPWSWESSDWLDFLLRDWLVLCSVGQVQVWLWFQGWSVILLLVLFSLLAPVSGPGCFSFTGSCYRAKECFFSSGQSVFLWLALFTYTV